MGVFSTKLQASLAFEAATRSKVGSCDCAVLRRTHDAPRLAQTQATGHVEPAACALHGLLKLLGHTEVTFALAQTLALSLGDDARTLQALGWLRGRREARGQRHALGRASALERRNAVRIRVCVAYGARHALGDGVHVRGRPGAGKRGVCVDARLGSGLRVERLTVVRGEAGHVQRRLQRELVLKKLCHVYVSLQTIGRVLRQHERQRRGRGQHGRRKVVQRVADAGGMLVRGWGPGHVVKQQGHSGGARQRRHRWDLASAAVGRYIGRHIGCLGTLLGLAQGRFGHLRVRGRWGGKGGRRSAGASCGAARRTTIASACVCASARRPVRPAGPGGALKKGKRSPSEAGRSVQEGRYGCWLKGSRPADAHQAHAAAEAAAGARTTKLARSRRVCRRSASRRCTLARIDAARRDKMRRVVCIQCAGSEVGRPTFVGRHGAKLGGGGAEPLEWRRIDAAAEPGRALRSPRGAVRRAGIGGEEEGRKGGGALGGGQRSDRPSAAVGGRCFKNVDGKRKRGRGPGEQFVATARSRRVKALKSVVQGLFSIAAGGAPRAGRVAANGFNGGGTRRRKVAFVSEVAWLGQGRYSEVWGKIWCERPARRRAPAFGALLGSGGLRERQKKAPNGGRRRRCRRCHPRRRQRAGSAAEAAATPRRWRRRRAAIAVHSFPYRRCRKKAAIAASLSARSRGTGPEVSCLGDLPRRCAALSVLIGREGAPPCPC
eukprot:354060-Chlamydomonas_euryale.AAC.1